MVVAWRTGGNDDKDEKTDGEGRVCRSVDDQTEGIIRQFRAVLYSPVSCCKCFNAKVLWVMC